MNHLASSLLSIMNIYPSSSSDYRIARYLLDHLESIDRITSSSLASACHCSKSTITRFCERLRLQDFYELKQLYYITSHHQSKKYQSTCMPADYFKEVSSVCKVMEENIDQQLIDQLCNDIECHDHVLIAGTMQSNHIALSFQHDLYALHKIVECKILEQEQIQSILQASQDDLIIIFSNTGLFLERLNVDPSMIQAKVYFITCCNQARIDSCTLIDLKLENLQITPTLSLKILADYIIQCYAKKAS